jgi:ketosteroid isomerase-like protein
MLTFVVAAIGVAWGCNAPAPDDSGGAPVATAGSADVESTITKLEEQWVAAILAKDTATIDRLLSDDFVGTTDDRRYAKQQAIDDVKEGTHESLRLDDLQVRVFGDTAIVDVDQTEKSRHGDEDFSGTYMFTNVWVKRNGEWQAVASHGSRIR